MYGSSKASTLISFERCSVCKKTRHFNSLGKQLTVCNATKVISLRNDVWPTSAEISFRCTVTWLPNFLRWVVYHIFFPRKAGRRQRARPAVCTLPMVPCGSSPVARLYLAKNEAPEEEAAGTLCCGKFECTSILGSIPPSWTIRASSS